MLALRCQASLGQLSLEEVERPAVSQADQVLVRVGYAGLCGTDLHIMSVSTQYTLSGGPGEKSATQGEFAVVGEEKVTLSHEFAGTVK